MNNDYIIEQVAKQYNLNPNNPPDITDPKISRIVDERIAKKCRPKLEAWDRAEAASRAGLKHYWLD